MEATWAASKPLLPLAQDLNAEPNDMTTLHKAAYNGHAD